MDSLSLIKAVPDLKQRFAVLMYCQIASLVLHLVCRTFPKSEFMAEWVLIAEAISSTSLTF